MVPQTSPATIKVLGSTRRLFDLGSAAKHSEYVATRAWLLHAAGHIANARDRFILLTLVLKMEKDELYSAGHLLLRARALFELADISASLVDVFCAIRLLRQVFEEYFPPMAKGSAPDGPQRWKPMTGFLALSFNMLYRLLMAIGSRYSDLREEVTQIWRDEVHTKVSMEYAPLTPLPTVGGDVFTLPPLESDLQVYEHTLAGNISWPMLSEILYDTVETIAFKRPLFLKNLPPIVAQQVRFEHLQQAYSDIEDQKDGLMRRLRIHPSLEIRTVEDAETNSFRWILVSKEPIPRGTQLALEVDVPWTGQLKLGGELSELAEFAHRLDTPEVLILEKMFRIHDRSKYHHSYTDRFMHWAEAPTKHVPPHFPLRTYWTLWNALKCNELDFQTFLEMMHLLKINSIPVGLPSSPSRYPFRPLSIPSLASLLMVQTHRYEPNVTLQEHVHCSGQLDYELEATRDIPSGVIIAIDPNTIPNFTQCNCASTRLHMKCEN